MLHILLGNSAADADSILGIVKKRKRSLLWVVPKTSHIGDRVLFHLPKYGFVARGQIGSAPTPERPRRYLAMVDQISLLSHFVPLSYIRVNHPMWKWPTYPRGYTIVDGAIEARLESLLNRRAEFIEGEAIRTTSTSYERNADARRECLREYGTACYVCGLSFGKTYGDYAEGYIHVHHLRTVASRGGKYRVNPTRDLRPVCPNCHAAIHLQRPPQSISAFKREFATRR